MPVATVAMRAGLIVRGLTMRAQERTVRESLPMSRFEHRQPLNGPLTIDRCLLFRHLDVWSELQLWLIPEAHPIIDGLARVPVGFRHAE